MVSWVEGFTTSEASQAPRSTPKRRTREPWEKLSIIVGNALGLSGNKVIRTDETRRMREELGLRLYNELGYFERGIESIRRLLVEKGVLTDAEIESRMRRPRAVGKNHPFKKDQRRRDQTRVLPIEPSPAA